MSADSGYSSCSSCDLPASSYDGSHLPWKAFRNIVLAPHHIQVLETVPKEKLPQSLLSLIEAGSEEISRFETQKTAFRAQVVTGRGFGPSPLFPPNLLPSIDDEPRLTRCMVPSFSREALPERSNNQVGPLYELSVPRPGLACGFSVSALSTEETRVIPSHLVATGTRVNFDSGYISPGAAVYCPFLTFERAYGVKEHRLETANNQCAIGGAWCTRAVQMLYVQAWKGETLPPMPVAFSCAIDNSFAIINFHWIGQQQTYCMSPLCKFDLGKDDHFTKFQVWIEAIGRWAVDFMLPTVKQAIQRLEITEPTPPATPDDRSVGLSLDTGRCPDEMLIKSLKTTFDDIPWRYEEEDCTPVSSSTASWGSPMVTDITFTYPASNSAQSAESGSTATANTATKRHVMVVASGASSAQLTPPPAYAQSPILVLQKRLDHANSEVRELQRQVHLLKTGILESQRSVQAELSAVKTTLASVLRKETFMVRNRSLSAGSGLGLNLASSTDSWNGPVSPPLQRAPFSRNFSSAGTGSGSNNNITGPSRLVLTRSLSSPSPTTESFPDDSASDAGATVGGHSSSSGETDTETITGCCPNSPTHTLIPTMPPTPYTPAFGPAGSMVVPPPPPPAGLTPKSLVKWTLLAFSAHSLASFIPLLGLRVVILGCVTEAAMLACASPGWSASWEWVLAVVRGR